MNLRSRFGRETQGAALLEFAFALPVLLLLGFGAFAATEYILVSRKVALAGRTVADLASKYATISDADMSNILNASALVIAPFPQGPLSVRLSEISTDPTGLLSYVAWSKSNNGPAYIVGAPYTLPADLRSPNAVFILSEVSYTFQPAANYGIAAPFTTATSFLVPPRGVDAVRYTGS